MSEVIKSNSGRLDRQPLRVPLSLLSGELTAERYMRCDEYLKNSGADQFYRAGRLTPEGTMQAGVFKRALQQVRIAEDEQYLYVPWSALSRSDILHRGANNSPVDTEQIEALRVQGDIAVHIMDKLQSLQASQYPEVNNDMRIQRITTGAFALVLSSIHGHPLK